MLRKVDGAQQKYQPLAFVFGVVKKYGDDNGGVLVANLRYTAFCSFFPLLLVLVPVVGLAGLGWGTTGLAQAGLFTMEQVCNLPGPARPGFLPRLARSLLFLVLLGLVVIATSLLAGLSTYGHHALSFVIFTAAVTATVNAG